MVSTVLATIEKALALQAKGSVNEAKKLFTKVVRSDPSNIAALYSLAVIHSNEGRHADALNLLSKVTELSPGFAQAWLTQSIVELRAGLLPQAKASAARALALMPSLSGLEEHIQQMQTLSMAQAPAAGHGLSEAALRYFSQATQALEQGDLATATQHYGLVLKEHPQHFFSLYQLGVIFNQQGLQQQALTYLRSAVDASPKQAEGHYALGTVLLSAGLLEEALACTQQALDLKKNYKEAYVNKSVILTNLDRHPEALAALNEALGLFPEDQGLLNNFGHLLSDFKLFTESADAYKRLMTLNPGFESVQGLHAYARLHACDWTNFFDNQSEIIQGITEGKPVCNPLALMAFTDDPDLHHKCAQMFSASKFPATSSPLWTGERYRHGRIRVAFLSADFREHPVGYLLVGLIESLNKDIFETVGISNCKDDGSDIFRRFRLAFDHYLLVKNKPALEVAQILRAFEVDIAIDLSGFTQGSRLDVLSHRPAPRQATFLGFPGTIGAPYLDYLIADPFTVPLGSESHYSERVVRLPFCYLPRDVSTLQVRSTMTRDDYCLPQGKRVLCSFNHDYKINPALFDVWMRVLQAEVDSVLWLMKLNEQAMINLKKEADARGIDPARLIFASRVPSVHDHLGRYRHVDLCLDTFPYNGHTTSSDALCMGANLVTLSGKGFASRVAGSLLTDVRQSANITETWLAYESKIIEALNSPSVTKDTELAVSKYQQFPEAFGRALLEMFSETPLSH